MMFKKLILTVLLVSPAAFCFAQNKVVVVPLGGVDGPFAQMYWATVSSSGALIANTPGVIRAQRLSTGNFVVLFDVRNIDDCFANAGLANTNQGGTITGSVGVTRYALDSRGLYMRVVDLDGALADLPTTIQLACPPEVIRPIATKNAPTEVVEEGTYNPSTNQVD